MGGKWKHYKVVHQTIRTVGEGKGISGRQESNRNRVCKLLEPAEGAGSGVERQGGRIFVRDETGGTRRDLALNFLTGEF